MLVSLDLVHALLHVSQIINMQAAQLAADLAPTFSMFKMDIYSSILCLLSAVDALAVASSSGQAAFPASARAQPPDTLRGIPLNHCCRVLQRRRGFRPPCQRLLCQPSLAPPLTLSHPPRRCRSVAPPPRRRHLAATSPPSPLNATIALSSTHPSTHPFLSTPHSPFPSPSLSPPPSCSPSPSPPFPPLPLLFSGVQARAACLRCCAPPPCSVSCACASARARALRARRRRWGRSGRLDYSGCWFVWHYK